MNDKQLKTLIKAVECGSFCKAEEALFLSKQALKKHIDALENEVGCPLLVRTHQGITLTHAGEGFYHSAKKILDEMDFATQKCKDTVSRQQTIRIESPPHSRLLLENVFAEFYRKYPYTNQQIILKPSVGFVDDILNGRADVAEYIYHAELDEFGVQYQKLFPMPYKCLVAPSHPLAGHNIIRMEELSGNHIGMHNNNLLSEMKESCHDFTLEVISNDLQKINNICYNGGIFISKAYFLNSMQPLIPIQLKTDSVPMAVILYHQSPTPITLEFLNVVRELYPQEGVMQ